MYGLGIADMKFFFPAVINAAQAFSKTKLKAPTDYYCYFVTKNHL